MTFVVRLVQVLLALLAVLVAGVFIMALGSQDTGLVEKVVVLLLVAALCVGGAFTLARQRESAGTAASRCSSSSASAGHRAGMAAR